MSFMDNLLSRFRKIFVNSITAFFLLLIIIGVFSSIASLFDSDEIETKDKILYLEPKGVIVDKAITRDDPFEDFELFGSSTNQIELDDILKIIDSAGVDDNLKAIYLDVDGLRAYYTSALKIAEPCTKQEKTAKRLLLTQVGLEQLDICLLLRQTR